MEIKNQWKASFYDNEILFATSSEDIYIGARSMVDGMGLSWGTQYLKIKNEFGDFFTKTL